MFEAGLFVETFLPLFILSTYKNSVHLTVKYSNPRK